MPTKKAYKSRRPNRDRSKLHCVIGETVIPNKNIERTWLETEKDAVGHATRLLRSKELQGDTKTRRLLVVKVVRVVEIEETPVTARTPKAKGETFGQPQTPTVDICFPYVGLTHPNCRCR
jgi:hypothetical protein